MQTEDGDLQSIVRADPAVEHVVGFTGGGAAQWRLHVRHAETAGRAQGVGRPGGGAPAREDRQRTGRQSVPAGRCRTSASGDAQGRPPTSTPCRPTISADLRTWEPRIATPFPTCRNWSMSTPTSRTRACRPRSRSIAMPRRVSASRPAISTRLSTMPLASDRCRRFTTPLNQYNVVMEVVAGVLAEPRGAGDSSTCSRVGGVPVPLATFAH